jgi:GntR family transcriptional regulator of arabinose operon
MEFGFGLTTFRHPKKELGHVAAETLLKLIKEQEAADVKFPPNLAERTSIKNLK